MASTLLDSYRQLELLATFVRRDLRDRYVQSAFGLTWALIRPAILLLIYTFVFSVALKVEFAPRSGITNFVLYLFCGMVPWAAVSEALSRSTTCIPDNASLLKRVSFPTQILPLHLTLTEICWSMVWLLLLLLVVPLAGYSLGVQIFLLPAVLILQLLLTWGLAMLLACAHVFFRDTQHAVQVGLMVWMFITPIFYPASILYPRFKWLLILNPMAHLVGIYRELILNNRLPHPLSITLLTLFAISFFALGRLVFQRHRHRFADLV